MIHKGEQNLHNPRRIFWRVTLVFCIAIPLSFGLFSRLLAFFRLGVGWVTYGAQRHFASHDFWFYFCSGDFATTLKACGGGKRPVALQNMLHASEGFKGIDILGIVLQGWMG